jgi:hypothetical protein
MVSSSLFVGATPVAANELKTRSAMVVMRGIFMTSSYETFVSAE